MLGTIWHLLEDSAVFLLVGFLLAGFVDALMAGHLITRHLQRRGTRPVILATMLGAPLPLCSCSVLPTALTLRRRGASSGATLSFLVSTPETSITSVLLSLGLLGPALAIVRPIAACMTAIAAGLAANLWERRTAPKPIAPAFVASHPPEPAALAGCADPCCDDRELPAGVPFLARLRRGLRFAFVDLFDDIFGWVLFGIVAAAALQHWIPPEALSRLGGGGIGTMLVLAAIGVPLYVCAEASTPIAATLIASGVSPGAALVFLLTGPATNLGTIGVLRRELGSALVWIYLATIVGAAIAAGLAVDAWVIDARGAVAAVEGESVIPRSIEIAAAVVFLSLGLGWFVRRKPLTRLVHVLQNPLRRVGGVGLEKTHDEGEHHTRQEGK
jgi:uncharacterized membrane protein YraQ (UPF0718 family)